METVGFIGLGAMGGPVAGHIQRAGYPMVVYDVRGEHKNWDEYRDRMKKEKRVIIRINIEKVGPQQARER